ncbi:hypothetical protein Tco_0495311, partial [Tanacetum coccineum]
MSVVWLTMHDVSVEDVTSGMVNHDLSIDAKINEMECKMLKGKLMSESFGSPSLSAKLDT